MKFAGSLASLLLALGAATAAAGDCKPLNLVTSVAMRIGRDGRIYTPVKIGGAPKSMLVDTGGFFVEITPDTVGEMNLDTRHTALAIIGVAGDTTSLVANASSMDFLIMPDNQLLSDDVSDAAGIIAPSFMRNYDVELDFAGRRLNLLSQDHCAGKVVYWPADKVAIVPIRLNSDGHIEFQVQLDSKTLTAILDTGATNSVLNLEVAQDVFGIRGGDAHTPETGHLTGANPAKTYIHRFKTLSLEGIAVNNPTLDLIPDIIRTKMRDPRDTLSEDTRLRDPARKTTLDDMILGMDILRRLHVYIAYREKKLYIPRAAPAASAEAAAAAQPQRP
jgi:predicted aspartyl protease